MRACQVLQVKESTKQANGISGNLASQKKHSKDFQTNNSDTYFFFFFAYKIKTNYFMTKQVV